MLCPAHTKHKESTHNYTGTCDVMILAFTSTEPKHIEQPCSELMQPAGFKHQLHSSGQQCKETVGRDMSKPAWQWHVTGCHFTGALLPKDTAPTKHANQCNAVCMLWGILTALQTVRLPLSRCVGPCCTLVSRRREAGLCRQLRRLSRIGTSHKGCASKSCCMRGGT